MSGSRDRGDERPEPSGVSDRGGPKLPPDPYADTEIDRDTSSFDPDRTVLTPVPERREGGLTPNDSIGLDRYRDISEIGRGGMGVIHRGVDPSLRREVAIKVLGDEAQTSPMNRKRFLSEARVTAQLEHPNIVPVYELTETAEGGSFAMKLVRGESLKDRIELLRDGGPEGPDPWEAYPLTRRLTDFLKVCDAVAFAHSRGVIHRDLKPGNVMIGEFGEVLVLDWGLSRLQAGAEGATRNIDVASIDRETGDVTPLETIEGKRLGTPMPVVSGDRP